MNTTVLVAGLIALAACGYRSSSGEPRGGLSGEPTEPGQEGTGSVGTIEGEDLRDIPTGQADQLLAGRVAGVQIVRMPGGGISVRIRGQGTLYGDSEPLYVVDGMPVHTEPGKGLNWLNTADIARIEVLKDAIATSSYGMRGANGVVLITTRRGGNEEE